jgi:hypothetical protein
MRVKDGVGVARKIANALINKIGTSSRDGKMKTNVGCLDDEKEEEKSDAAEWISILNAEERRERA